MTRRINNISAPWWGREACGPRVHALYCLVRLPPPRAIPRLSLSHPQYITYIAYTTCITCITYITHITYITCTTYPPPERYRFHHYPPLRPSIFLHPSSITIPSFLSLSHPPPFHFPPPSLPPSLSPPPPSSAKLLSKNRRSREKPTSTLAPMWSLPQLLQGLSKKIAFLQLRKKSKRVFDTFEKSEKI